MIDFFHEPIIVTGCARSGTSMVAGILNLCGAWVGQCTGSTRWNPKGQFENEYIRDKMTKPFLERIGADPMGQDPLPDVDWESKYMNLLTTSEIWKNNIFDRLLKEGYMGDRPWLFKGAKACLIWQLWHRVFPNATWIIVRRNDEKIIDSCMKTSFMRRRKTRESWAKWVDYHKRRFNDMAKAGLRTFDFWPNEALSVGSLEPFRVLSDLCKLNWNGDGVENFLDRSIWHG